MFFLMPYGNDRPSSRFPAVTYALIAANLLVYVWMRVPPFDHEAALRSMGLIAAHPSVSSILTSMFLHADLLHLAWNMLFLWLFGPSVEDVLGRLEYGIFYFGSGFAAALLHVVVAEGFTPLAADVPMAGASGAIAGILGIFAIRFYKTKIRALYIVLFLMFIGWGRFIIPAWFALLPLFILTLRGRYTVPAWIGLGIWFVQQLVMGLLGIVNPQSGGVAYWSHIGGMLFGMALAYALRMGLEGTREYLMSDAKANIAQGTTLGAIESLLSLLERDPESADVHRALAGTYTIQQNSERAIAHYLKSIELYLRKGERARAIEGFCQLKQHYPNARLSLRSAYQVARCLVETNNHLPALLMLEGIADTYPATPEAEMALMMSGDIYLNVLGHPQGAVKCYERFLREYPQSSYRAMVEKALADARARQAGDAGR
ncbi:MAG TPA: rhomboid family intramembrane serine protease [Armatimonadota bacterium]|nr:rhomboid family intramembrane serine protease [Armatimonadota bacterium]